MECTQQAISCSKLTSVRLESIILFVPNVFCLANVSLFCQSRNRFMDRGEHLVKLNI